MVTTASSFCGNAAWMLMRCSAKLFPRIEAIEKTMKIELYWIENSWTGRLAIAARPRGRDWLEDEAQAWRRAGLDVVVSLLTPDEVSEFDLAGERDVCRANDIAFVSFPIPDRGVPTSRQDAVDLLKRLGEALGQGKRVAIHCRQGIGRSALVAASLLVLSGLAPDLAFRRVSAARGCSVPETSEQRAWVAEFARELMTPLPQ